MLMVSLLIYILVNKPRNDLVLRKKTMTC